MNTTNKFKKKVLVNGHDQKFWYPLQAELEKTGLFEFREDLWSGHNSHDPQHSFDLLEWADIIFSEWTLGNAVFYSKHKKKHQRHITRFHAQEIRTDFPSQLEMENVDCFIFVGPHLLENAIVRFGIPREKTFLLHNFVDFGKFNLPKMGGELFNLGMIGMVPAQKRVDRAFDLLTELLSYDSRYMLHVKGPSPESYSWLWARTKEREYYEKLFEKINSSDMRYNVVFDPHGNDVDQWLKKIGFVLSPSESESFHMAAAEGMASGSIPIFWKREGVDEIFKPFQNFNSIENIAKNIDLVRKSNVQSALIEQAKQFVQNNFSQTAIVQEWVNILTSSDILSESFEQSAVKKKNVVVVYAIDAWETFHRREMLEALAKNLSDFDFLIVEPGSHYKTLLERNICSEHDLNHYATLNPIQVGENIYKIRVLNGGFLSETPVHEELKKGHSYENSIQIAIKHIFGKTEKLLHWIYKPDQQRFAMKRDPYIYEVYDEYTMDFSTGAIDQNVAELEPSVLKEAQHVFFTSEPLAERKKIHSTSWNVVGNGVAYEVFEQYKVQTPRISGLRKSVGYLGNLSDFFDWTLMFEVCRQMDDVDFYFHGQVEHHRLDSVKESVELLMHLPNTYFSGRVNRHVGAAAINRYDSLIIPFVVNEAMHAVNPLKLWEYFATGKPVISTPMDAVKIPSPLMFVANETQEWIECLQKALNENDEHIANQRISLARENSWEHLTKLHATTINHLFIPKQR